MSEKVESILILKADELTPAKRLELGISTGFVEIKRVRASPLRTVIEPINGLPSDLLLKRIKESTFNDKKLID